MVNRNDFVPPGDPVNVLALGSSHGNDRVAWDVAEDLTRQELPAGVGVHQLSTPWEVVDFCHVTADLIIIDACVSGGIPGTAFWLSAENIETTSSPRSSHGIDLRTMLEIARGLGRPPRRLAILGIAISPPDLKATLDHELILKIPDYVHMICERIALWNGVCKLNP